jgi:predicted amidohydrolase YtcJ
VDNQVIYYNANIHTMDNISARGCSGVSSGEGRAPVRASAIAVRDDKIVAVGVYADVESALAGRYRKVNLQGLTVVPGFTDCHIHLLWYALKFSQVDLGCVESIEEVKKRIRNAAHKSEQGQWIIGHGWSHSCLANAHPHRVQLDDAAPNNPIVLFSKDRHSIWVNSLALAMAGIDRNTPDPDGGVIERDPNTREPTGILRENAQPLISRVIPAPDFGMCKEAIARVIPYLHQLGITGIHDCGDEVSFGVLQELLAEDNLDLRICEMLPLHNLDAAIKLGIKTGFGNARLRIGPLKVFVDGALGSGTAALLEPYSDNPDNVGVCAITEEELTDIIIRASRSGISVAAHAIGDRAVRMALDALEKSKAGRRPDDTAPLHNRIEHAQLVSLVDLGRFASLGVIASIQPIHATSDRYMADKAWGTRSSIGYPMRSLAENGVRLAFGSDAPVEEPDPIQGIFAAVTRKRHDELSQPGWHTEQCLTVEEAVRGYTTGAAYASGQEHIKGSITPGKLADFVILSKDIFTVNPLEIADTKILGTVVGGKVVFDQIRLKGD